MTAPPFLVFTVHTKHISIMAIGHKGFQETDNGKDNDCSIVIGWSGAKSHNPCVGLCETWVFGALKASCSHPAWMRGRCVDGKKIKPLSQFGPLTCRLVVEVTIHRFMPQDRQQMDLCMTQSFHRACLQKNFCSFFVWLPPFFFFWCTEFIIHVIREEKDCLWQWTVFELQTEA